MLGHSYEVVIAGKTYLVDGTSAAAPVFAGVLSLVNSARIKAGKSPVGFANTALYQLAQSNPEAFLDVTTGEVERVDHPEFEWPDLFDLWVDYHAQPSEESSPKFVPHTPLHTPLLG